eukprot:10943657-Alexandrium_andersonii.AAC.1
MAQPASPRAPCCWEPPLMRARGDRQARPNPHAQLPHGAFMVRDAHVDALAAEVWFPKGCVFYVVALVRH